MQQKRLLRKRSLLVVRVMGLEPIRPSTHAPQTCLSAYSSTLALQYKSGFTRGLSPDCFNIIAHKKRFVKGFLKNFSDFFSFHVIAGKTGIKRLHNLFPLHRRPLPDGNCMAVQRFSVQILPNRFSHHKHRK